jgi:predicted DNA binding CopG/RHH family protein
MEFDWDAANVAHTARHGITAEEWEEAYWNGPMVIEVQKRKRECRRLCLGGDRRGQAADLRDRRTQGQDPVCHRAPDARETAGDQSRRGMMPTRNRIPNFKSEREEAQWWDAHPAVVAALFPKAKKEGKIKRLPVIRGATRSTTIRLPIADIETAQQIAERRGLPYQTYLKGLLHQALESERKAG